MPANWYYVADGDRRGPHTDAEMKRLGAVGTVTRETLVWNESMGGDWVAAGSVAGLLEQTPAEPAHPIPPPLDGSMALKRRVSVINPVDTAWKRMVEVLFSPFDMGKWFALGVSAWLATLGQGMGGGGGGNPGAANMHSRDGSAGLPTMDEIGQTYSEQVQPFLQQYMQIIVWSVIGVVLLVLVLSLVVLWLQSRGRFMLLDNVVNNRADVKNPWHVFSQHAGSLFRWSVVYSILCLIIGAMLLVGTVMAVIIPGFQSRSVTAVLPAAVLLGLMWLVFMVVTGYVSRFLQDFVVPLMYRHDLTCTEAWGRLLPLVKANFWRFALYGFFYVILGAASGMAVMLLIVVTCCIAGCLLAIPFINAVVLLPATVFFRCYSLDYLAQFGPQFEMVLDEATE